MSLVFDLLGYRRRWRLLEQLRTPYVSETAPIVVGGCGSSGTTLLRRMLDRHPAVCCGPESTVFLERVSGPEELASRLGFRADQIEGWQCASRSQAEFIDRFQSASLARSGKRVWADKTPENVRRFAFVRRHFPKARLIHMIRDGRDVACSLRSQGWMKVRHRTPSDAAARCAAYWVERVSAGRASRSDPGYIEIRYEQLVRDPEPTLRRLLGFLGLEWSDRVLVHDSNVTHPAAGPAFTTSIGRWRREFTARDCEMVEAVAGDLLTELGYDQDVSFPQPRVEPLRA
ncbi:MAG TPA: sulfotransferase [Stellaceae bacterium]|nr:sulfotransferase [Stellaceae bacterium]